MHLVTGKHSPKFSIKITNHSSFMQVAILCMTACSGSKICPLLDQNMIREEEIVYYINAETLKEDRHAPLQPILLKQQIPDTRKLAPSCTCSTNHSILGIYNSINFMKETQVLTHIFLVLSFFSFFFRGGRGCDEKNRLLHKYFDKRS